MLNFTAAALGGFVVGVAVLWFWVRRPLRHGMVKIRGNEPYEFYFLAQFSSSEDADNYILWLNARGLVACRGNAPPLQDERPQVSWSIAVPPNPLEIRRLRTTFDDGIRVHNGTMVISATSFQRWSFIPHSIVNGTSTSPKPGEG
jgi:hypothetical protein